MTEIFGEMYYIDFKALDKFVEMNGDSDRITETTKELLNENGDVYNTEVTITKEPKHKEINGVSFELIRGFIFDLGGDGESLEMDEALSYNNLGKMSVKFKLAFNTLLFYKILKKID